MITALDLVRTGADQQHIFTCKRGANGSLLDLAMARDRAHLEIVSHDEMFIAELFAQQFRHDVVVERRGLEQTTGHCFSDIDIWKTAVTDHYTTHAIVASLKEFDVRRKILCDQIVMRQLHNRHLFM